VRHYPRLAQQPVADHAAGDLGAFGAGERRVVDAERHRQGRRVDRLRVDRRLDHGIADGVGDGGVGQSGEGDNVAGLRLLDRNAFETRKASTLVTRPVSTSLPS